MNSRLLILVHVRMLIGLRWIYA